MDKFGSLGDVKETPKQTLLICLAKSLACCLQVLNEIRFTQKSDKEAFSGFPVLQKKRKGHPGKNMVLPGVSKGCCFEVFKYSRASKRHSFVTPGTAFCRICELWVICRV